MNVIEPILFQCRFNPLTLAICSPGASIESVSYGQLEKFIHNVARNALKAGLVPGERIALFVSDTILHSSLAFGLMRLGIATLSLRQPQIQDEFGLNCVLTDQPQLFASKTVNVVRVDPSWVHGDGTPPDYETINQTPEHNLCRIMLTTGSTGRAKGVPFSHRELMDRIAHLNYTKGPRFAHCPRFFCDLGLTTTPGFCYALTLLGRGGTIYYLGAEPADILQVIGLHEIQGMATSPYGLGEFMKFFEADPDFEVTFDHVICQGAMLSRELSHRARARMCSNLYSSYGSTETTTVASAVATMTEGIPGAVGYVQPGVRVEIVNKDGQILPRGRDGLLRVRTRYMATGYVGDPEATKQYFHDGCFYPGDIGHLREDEMLVITGREKTAMNIGGDTISPEVIEEMLTSFPGVNDAAVLAISNELGINEVHALIVANPAVAISSLRAQCASRVAPSCVPVRFLAVPAIPRGSQGKIERHRLEDCAKSAMAIK